MGSLINTQLNSLDSLFPKGSPFNPSAPAPPMAQQQTFSNPGIGASGNSTEGVTQAAKSRAAAASPATAGIGGGQSQKLLT